MDKVTAPFTDDQVSHINDYQQYGKFHPFTCCSHEGCKREEQKDNGALIATNEGLVCPCGKWKQDWVHSFMTEFESFDTKRVTLFRGLRFTKPKGVVPLIEVLHDISTDKWKDRVLKCRTAPEKKDYLPVFTPTGIFTHRSIPGLQKYNGVIYLDIDHLKEQGTTPEKLKDQCKEIPWVYAAYVTPSGDGMKVLVHTDATVETYREMEEQVSSRFLSLTKCKRDPRCKDIARIHYISYDPEIWISPFAVKFDHEPFAKQLEIPV
jgi:hypothetical protein